MIVGKIDSGYTPQWLYSYGLDEADNFDRIRLESGNGNGSVYAMA